MSIRNFFNLKFSKIALTVLIFIFINYFEIRCTPFEVHGPIGSGAGWHYPCGFLSQTMLRIFNTLYSLGVGYFELSLFLLAISFIISCGIMTIYNKFKKYIDKFLKHPRYSFYSKILLIVLVWNLTSILLGSPLIGSYADNQRVQEGRGNFANLIVLVVGIIFSLPPIISFYLLRGSGFFHLLEMLGISLTGVTSFFGVGILSLIIGYLIVYLLFKTVSIIKRNH